MPQINGISGQTPLVSGTNIKTLNGTSLLGSGNTSVPTLASKVRFVNVQNDGTQVTNTTTQTITFSVLIPANTFQSSTGIIQIELRTIRVSGTASNVNTRLYKNTSNTITGASNLGSFTTMSATTQLMGGMRFLRLYNNYIYGFVQTASTDAVTQTGNETVNIPFNVAVDNYIFVTIQFSSLSADVAKGAFVRVVGYDAN